MIDWSGVPPAMMTAFIALILSAIACAIALYIAERTDSEAAMAAAKALVVVMCICSVIIFASRTEPW